ncbi:MAG TPA: hypothetical protein VGW12_21610 [Pyrinomonadaceae bacterium]|nr:hypothetical protein [Pyrinomonadaceae bacterium]
MNDEWFAHGRYERVHAPVGVSGEGGRRRYTRVHGKSTPMLGAPHFNGARARGRVPAATNYFSGFH